MKRLAFGTLALLTLSQAPETPETSPSPSASPEAVIAPQGPTFPTVTVEPLLRDVAASRAKQIQNQKILLSVDLTGSKSYFQARATLEFGFRDRPNSPTDSKKVPLDLDGALIDELWINSVKQEKIDSDRYDGLHIWLSPKELQPGPNKIEIAYRRAYETNGNGLHRYEDELDQTSYLYTNFEPYFAHRLFPCFDQPDLKLRFRLDVRAPKDWTVISAVLPSKPVKGGEKPPKDVKDWNFPETDPMSPHVFPLIAGPFHSWDDKSASVPLRLFARKSQAKFVDAADWFKVTRQGLEFFSTHFGKDFPYKKYDQIIVPELNASGMENLAASTFTESYLYRVAPTQDQKRERAETILHELAHMWFGNFVTLRWWNGLWLKEGFATFAANWAIDQTQLFKDSWQSFFQGSKEWAYWEDSLATTHVVDVSVKDTSEAYSFFDGITYGKGAALMKQLWKMIGEDAFRDGLQRYFSKFANRNATLTDLMAVFSEASSRDLMAWQRHWLQTPGLNTIEVQMACEDPAGPETHASSSPSPSPAPTPTQAYPSPAPTPRPLGEDETSAPEPQPSPSEDDEKESSEDDEDEEDDIDWVVKSFRIKQSAPGAKNVIRPHQLEVGLYYTHPEVLQAPKKGKKGKPAPVRNLRKSRGQKLVADESVEVFMNSEFAEVPEMIGRPCPDLVLPNVDDSAYVRVKLDPRSLETLETHRDLLEPVISRQMVWHALWEAVISGNFSAEKMAGMILDSLPKEKNTLILSRLMSYLIPAEANDMTLWKFLNSEQRAALRPQVETVLKKGFLGAAKGSDLKRIWFGTFAHAAESPEALTTLKTLLGPIPKGKKKALPAGSRLNAEQRWAAITVLAKRGDPSAQERLEFELAIDPTDQAKRNSQAVMAAFIDPANKKKWLESFATAIGSPDLLKTAMTTWLSTDVPNVPEEVVAAENDFFNQLERVLPKGDDDYLEGFVRHLYPSRCNPEQIEAAEKWLRKKEGKIPAVAYRALASRVAEDAICARIRRR
ncbi:MAG: ERAP1-like C-terminal domain-containing protein [Bdellovibrionales bacterium]|nr:ERAP1-like C-terminal domain-containing protein [Bdellovibrionales bacterium]